MNISIRYIDPGNQKPPFKMFVLPSDTIALLKYHIFEKHDDIPIWEQRMLPIVEGQEPPGDERSVESCGFAEGDVVKMYRMPTPWRVYGMDEGFLLGIRPILGTVFLLEVRRSDTFGAVKQRIQDEKGYMANTQDFRFGDDEDEKTLDECRVIEPMTLQFHLKRRKKVTKLTGGGDADTDDDGSDDEEGGVEVQRRKKNEVEIRELHSGRNSPLE